ncbi:hypothetical protein EPUS_02663 [Endocarpon pusillum Z07020]|uniref:Uncharacterized protein n=1 Tax=Endocarpon pusillum (strain Z07020 / HMAS-L-300199) TaxID=1263415 RepID=U1GXT9_ENDPU|nr:uncharacterized protein EPUS_02663 [Endocarpon pusillum Z07020]ERF76951.1 hypothetical protein EPUS_02663 [Endocarpon pusillum Z07020]
MPDVHIAPAGRQPDRERAGRGRDHAGAAPCRRSTRPPADENTGNDCKTLGTFPVDIKTDITVASDVTGLEDDVRIFIFNRNLKEGFVKYKAARSEFRGLQPVPHHARWEP